jgi:hypothetical protein
MMTYTASKWHAVQLIAMSLILAFHVPTQPPEQPQRSYGAIKWHALRLTAMSATLAFYVLNPLQQPQSSKHEKGPLCCQGRKQVIDKTQSAWMNTALHPPAKDR